MGICCDSIRCTLHRRRCGGGGPGRDRRIHRVACKRPLPDSRQSHPVRCRWRPLLPAPFRRNSHRQRAGRDSAIVEDFGEAVDAAKTLPATRLRHGQRRRSVRSCPGAKAWALAEDGSRRPIGQARRRIGAGHPSCSTPVAVAKAKITVGVIGEGSGDRHCIGRDASTVADQGFAVGVLRRHPLVDALRFGRGDGAA